MSGGKKLDIMEFTALELGRKIKKKEISVLEAVKAAMEIGRAHV